MRHKVAYFDMFDIDLAQAFLECSDGIEMKLSLRQLLALSSLAEFMENFHGKINLIGLYMIQKTCIKETETKIYTSL